MILRYTDHQNEQQESKVYSVYFFIKSSCFSAEDEIFERNKKEKEDSIKLSSERTSQEITAVI